MGGGTYLDSTGLASFVGRSYPGTSTSLNDSASAVENYMTGYYTIYQNANYGGAFFSFAPGAYVWSLNAYGWNDIASSSTRG